MALLSWQHLRVDLPRTKVDACDEICAGQTDSTASPEATGVARHRSTRKVGTRCFDDKKVVTSRMRKERRAIACGKSCSESPLRGIDSAVDKFTPHFGDHATVEIDTRGLCS